MRSSCLGPAIPRVDLPGPCWLAALPAGRDRHPHSSRRRVRHRLSPPLPRAESQRYTPVLARAARTAGDTGAHPHSDHTRRAPQHQRSSEDGCHSATRRTEGGPHVHRQIAVLRHRRVDGLPRRRRRRQKTTPRCSTPSSAPSGSRPSKLLPRPLPIPIPSSPTQSSPLLLPPPPQATPPRASSTEAQDSRAGMPDRPPESCPA